MATEPLNQTDRAAYLRALKTGQATAESSAAFRKLLRFAVHHANELYPPEQLLLFGAAPKPKRVMLNTQAELF